MIYRPPEASSPTPDVRTSREIVAGLLGMAFLFAALIWYTADLWCGKAPWLCLDGLDGGVTMAGGTPTTVATRAPLAPSTAAAPPPVVEATPDPAFGAMPFAPALETPSFAPPAAAVATPETPWGDTLDLAGASPTSSPAAVSARRAAMTATAEAYGTVGGAPSPTRPGAPFGGGAPSSTATPADNTYPSAGSATASATAAATATDAAYP